MIHYDCHAHVFEEISTQPGARYVPTSSAPLALWLQSLKQHQLMGGVIVQVSFLGTDNSQLCSALQQLSPEHFAGVAVVALDVREEEIDRLRALGVRGFRWNLVRGGQIPELHSPIVKTFLERIFARGMHIEVQLESARLAPVIGPLLELGGAVVVDHLGLPAQQNPTAEPWLQAVNKIKDLSGLYVKLSGAYRTPFDIDAHAAAITELIPPNRLVWGSDWPHTQHELTTTYQGVAEARNNFPIVSDTNAVQTLYGLGDSARSI